MPMREAPAEPVHGIDGCAGGWLVATLAPGDPPELGFALHPDFAAAMAATGNEIAVVDIPIGLLEIAQPGGRPCDRTARQRLGWPRRNSVFSPPARPALAATDYRNAIARNGAGMSRQAYNILGKIAEVDHWITPERQARVVEGHPELAFMRLAGGAIAEPKRRAAGEAARRTRLERVLGRPVDPADTRTALGASWVARDDVLDAAVLTLTGCHCQVGTARREGGERDARGLEMAIRY